MEAGPQQMPIPANNNLKRGAKISLVSLLLAIIAQFVSVYQTSYQLVSPVIPQSTVWEINRQFLFTAFVFAIACTVALLLYFYQKYWWVIIVVVLVLIAGRFMYLPPSVA
jgi:hypothetical protein